MLFSLQQKLNKSVCSVTLRYMISSVTLRYIIPSVTLGYTISENYIYSVCILNFEFKICKHGVVLSRSLMESFSRLSIFPRKLLFSN
jgi:hypothetical protein